MTDKNDNTNWSRIYLFILGYNAFLILLFYFFRLLFNKG